MSNATPRRGVNWNDADEQIMKNHSLTRTEVEALRKAQERKPGVLRRLVSRLFRAPERAAAEIIRERATPAATPAPVVTLPEGHAASTAGTAGLVAEAPAVPEAPPAAPVSPAQEEATTAEAAFAPEETRAAPPKAAPRKRLPPSEVHWASVTTTMWETLNNRQLGELLNTRYQNVRDYRAENNLPEGPANTQRKTKYAWHRITPEIWRTNTDQQIANILNASRQAANRHRSEYNHPRYEAPENPGTSPSPQENAEAPSAPEPAAAVLPEPQAGGVEAEPNQDARANETHNWDNLTDEQWASLTNPEIAELVGCTPEEAHDERRKRYPQDTPKTPKRYNWESVTNEMWETMSNREVGEFLGGADPSGVGRYRRTNNKPKRNRKRNPEVNAEAPEVPAEPEKTSAPNLTDLFGPHPKTITLTAKKTRR